MHFTYSEPPLSPDLRQGDILRRTPEIDEVLKQAHPHYFQKSENKYFIILTQDCDLTRRDGKSCSARYIELAAVRPVSSVILRRLETIRERSIEFPVCTADNKKRLVQFLERLLNNNEPEYFYLHKERQCAFPDDCCALLSLSIAIKAEIHYDICVKAKLIELKDSFRAKLGWLVGRMYSPIGTQDWEPEERQEEIKEKIEELAIWIDPTQESRLKRLIKQWKQDNPGQALDAKIVHDLVSKVPPRKELVIDTAIKILQNKQLLPQGAEVKVGNFLRNDKEFSQLLR